MANKQTGLSEAAGILLGDTKYGKLLPDGREQPDQRDAFLFLHEAGWRGECSMLGCRAGSNIREIVPPLEISSLVFNPLAQNYPHMFEGVGLVAGNWTAIPVTVRVTRYGREPARPGEFRIEPVWRDIRFFEHEIERLVPVFAEWFRLQKNWPADEWLESKEPARNKAAPKTEAVRRAIAALYPNGVPDQVILPNDKFCDAVIKWLESNNLPVPSPKHIRRVAGRK